MRKEKWITPELIILAKSTPGEDILTVCKSVNHSVAELDGIGTSGQLCKMKQGQCGACQSEGGMGGS